MHTHDTASDDPPSATTAVSPHLYRARRGRLLYGVCAGAAVYVGWDVWLIRGLFLAMLCIGGLGVPVYLGAALLVPLEPHPDAT